MLFFSTLILAATLLSFAAQARDIDISQSFNPDLHKKTVYKAKAFRSTNPIPVSDHVVPIIKVETKEKDGVKSEGVDAKKLNYRMHPLPIGISTPLESVGGYEYQTNITYGNQHFTTLIDTGSSDTWVPEIGFECVDVDRTVILESECGFGALYNLTSTFSRIPDIYFNITYGDGRFAKGYYGYEIVTLAGITVNQTIAVVDYTGFYSSGNRSGIMGLAYPGLTYAYNSSIAPTHIRGNLSDVVSYDTIITTICKDGLDPCLFSLVLERQLYGPAGYLAFGGVPPIDFVQNFTETPILLTTLQGFEINELSFYTIEPDGVNLNGVALDSSDDVHGKIQYIIDSGATLCYLPTPLADQIAAAFDPPAVRFTNTTSLYYVNCTAKAPELAFVIGGVPLYINPLDMVYYDYTADNGTDICLSGVATSGNNRSASLYILGDTFMKNVVSVFDIGAGMMRFAGREYYPSNYPY